MKSQIRFSRASGSTRVLVERLVAKGWQPGDRVRDVLARRSRRNSFTAGIPAGVAR